MADTKNPDWLFMIYMVANESDKLDRLAVQDLREIEEAIGQNDHVEAFVQIRRHWPPNFERFHVAKPHGREPVTREIAVSGRKYPANMGKRETLEGFLNAALKLPRAKHYCLVLWGHNFGLGFGRDHGDDLTLEELQKALNKFNEARGTKLELLGANTCTLSYAEAIFQLRESADYMVASEVFVPFAGWPYDRILRDVGDDPSEELGRLILNRYLEYYTQPDVDGQVSMTLLNLRCANDLGPVVQDLANGIRSAIRGDPRRGDRLAQIRDAFLANPAGLIRPVLDLVGLACDLRKICGATQPEGVAADRVTDGLTALGRASEKVILTASPKAPGTGSQEARPTAVSQPKEEPPRLVVDHKAHPALGELHGVGIFAPFVVDDGRLARAELPQKGSDSVDTEDEALKRTRKGLNTYKSLSIFHLDETNASGGGGTNYTANPNCADWPDLVIHDLRPERSDEFVDSTGVVRLADRSAISHLVAAVDAAFRRLDRAIEAARTLLRSRLPDLRVDRSALLDALAYFGPPKLRLAGLGTLGVNPHKVLKPSEWIASAKPPEVILTLADLEDGLARVERTTRRVVTDANFGIGPPSVGGLLAFEGKPLDAGLADKPLDAGLADKPLDAGLADKPLDAGLGDKPLDAGLSGKTLDAGLGSTSLDGSPAADLGAKIVFAGVDPQLGSLAMISMFRDVARSLQRVERAMARVEQVVLRFLQAPHFGDLLPPDPADPADHLREAVREQIDEQFGLLSEARQQAQRVVRGVLQHPTYGLGPGPAALGRTAREALATSAGLSQQGLQLLRTHST